MTVHPYQDRIKRCTDLMKTTGLNTLLLTKPSNMFYLTDSRGHFMPTRIMRSGMAGARCRGI